MKGVVPLGQHLAYSQCSLCLSRTHTPEIQRTEQLFIMVFKLLILKESTLLPTESATIFIKKDFSFLKLSLLVIF